jgi:DNA polymerase-3 subunit epsilon
LLECTEIKDVASIHKALKRFEPKYGLFEYEARIYRYLAIGKLTKIRVALKL